ncbi:MAG TPA: hypothetical protein VHV83_04040, partial [Armatimonadota bacterium]|nr:hypothetical protein [Armatimonadota bacterium]
MKKFSSSILHCAVAVGAMMMLWHSPGRVDAQAKQSIGEWDGVTASAKLAGPYEDPRQANVPFGIISYYNQPWRSYMDTWPASKYLEVPGLNWNAKPQYAEALCQVLEEAGIKTVRYEIGWGSLNWNDQLP